MAKKFDLTSDDKIDNQDPVIEKDMNETSNPNPVFDNNLSLTVEEREDPNKIVVEIIDTAPIVILFGAKTSGKTMTLVRLSRYLKQNGYIVEPIRTFRPSNSKHYQEMCDNFNNNIFSDTAPGSTNDLSFMLVKVSNKYGDPICQLLEAPGEHYFNEEKDETFPPYIKQIRDNDNDKTWLFIVEMDWKDQATRFKYANKVKEMRNSINPKDKVILMCHKADMKRNSYYFKNNPDKHHFYRDIKQQYPAIFEGHKNHNPITRWFSPYEMKFVVFTAGDFTKASGGKETYISSNNKYPQELWRVILKNIKGAWF